MTARQLTIVSGAEIARLLPSLRTDILAKVEETYLQHSAGKTINPDSYFLRFPDNPSARIIALPAAITNEHPVSGIKWIASYPENIESNLQRASAVLLLNDYMTGYPVACLEASQISAARTAASAVVATRALHQGRLKDASIAFIGAGVIARSVFDFLQADGFTFSRFSIHDLNTPSANEMKRYVTDRSPGDCRVVETLRDAVDGTDIVVFATNAATPYVHGSDFFKPGQIVLNISLRDICPDIIWQAFNVFDDVEHCMKANTSPHLAEQKYGNRSFVGGTISDILERPECIDRQRPNIVSPFGLGVLDLVVGQLLYASALEQNTHISIPDFIPDAQRWPTLRT